MLFHFAVAADWEPVDREDDAVFEGLFPGVWREADAEFFDDYTCSFSREIVAELVDDDDDIEDDEADDDAEEGRHLPNLRLRLLYSAMMRSTSLSVRSGQSWSRKRNSA